MSHILENIWKIKSKLYVAKIYWFEFTLVKQVHPLTQKKSTFIKMHFLSSVEKGTIVNNQVQSETDGN